MKVNTMLIDQALGSLLIKNPTDELDTVAVFVIFEVDRSVDKNIYQTVFTVTYIYLCVCACMRACVCVANQLPPTIDAVRQ